MADNMEQINCPACGSVMEKVYMKEQGVHLDVCVHGCGGIYFDNREFAKFDEPHENIAPLLDVLNNKVFKPVSESQIRVCPVCGTNMVKNYTNPKHEIEVDECYTCGGKFLDCNELIKIRGQYPTEQERVNDILQQFSKDLDEIPQPQKNEEFNTLNYTKFVDNHKKSSAFEKILWILLVLTALAIAVYYLYYTKQITLGF